jgi:hypothetical protein
MDDLPATFIQAYAAVVFLGGAVLLLLAAGTMARWLLANLLDQRRSRRGVGRG